MIQSHSRPTRPSLLPVALPIHLAVTFSVMLQGALDGGLDIPHSEKRYVGYSSEGKSLDEETLKKYILGGHVSDSGCSESIVLRDCRLGLACRMQLHVCLLDGGYMSDRGCCAMVCTVELQIRSGLQDPAAEVDSMRQTGRGCCAVLF